MLFKIKISTKQAGLVANLFGQNMLLPISPLKKEKGKKPVLMNKESVDRTSNKMRGRF